MLPSFELNPIWLLCMCFFDFLLIFFWYCYRLDFERSFTNLALFKCVCSECTVAANLILSSNLMQSCWMKASSANYSESIHLVFHYIFRLIFSFLLLSHLLFPKHPTASLLRIRFASPLRSHKIVEKFRCKIIRNVDLLLCCLNGSIHIGLVDCNRVQCLDSVCSLNSSLFDET